MKIVVLDDYQDEVRTLDCASLLAGDELTVYNDTVRDADELVRRLAGAEAVVLIRDRTTLDRALIERLPALRLVSCVCRPGSYVDIAACTEHGIAVADGGPGYSPATVEQTWALILSSMRKLGLEERQLRAGRWQTSLGIGCLAGRTLGIYGYGRLGKMVADIGPAFGMRVLVSGTGNSIAKAAADGYDTAPDKAALFREADVLSIHLRLNEATRGIVTLDDLLSMKRDALFVNPSRAELVAPGALVEALKQGRPGYAAVDVYEEEPVLGASHPLLAFDNAVCAPHLGFADRDSYERYFSITFGNIKAYAAGDTTNIVNPEACGRAR
ncbi:Glycerate dehydrogenase [Pigmentiphaga humi]|uniref:Glycerate dehydrogenase n=1 Tax=Pigmentiphaga humi TaxID=2478468 RepID=A0A3P4B5N8_9BURK|nr:D-2-hydroxyacid dehydrogenase family protein [Pigmentiphaga humi]VCU71624.1 Glycerate dehydrogenase [Pigmentiphaga humi]